MHDAIPCCFIPYSGNPLTGKKLLLHENFAKPIADRPLAIGEFAT
jgi:hypothetical protein